MPEEPDSVSPEISVRLFVPRDAEGIAALIRRNYADTYYKALFYDPDAIQNTNATAKIISTVATYHETVIGHFAMFPSSFSDIAEIGAAVVDPAFKHLGIMNVMFDHLIADARERKFRAIFGEGIMLHPFSQKANLRHGMIESAIMLGEVPSSIEIEHRFKGQKRSGVVVAFLPFDKQTRILSLPIRYREIIENTYQCAGIKFLTSGSIQRENESPIDIRYNPLLKTGIIAVNADISRKQIDNAFEEMSAQQCDMVFADLNLHVIADIDRIVQIFNRWGFFYSGILFSYYHNEDYLRLQRKNSGEIDEENLICYSNFAEKLLAFILRDEASLDQ